MKNILWLDKIKREDADRVGGKAWSLAALSRSGFKVPRAFCLTTELFDQFLEENSFMSQVSLLRLGRDKSLLRNVCRRLSYQILRGKISSTVRKEIMTGVEGLKTDRLAVRSSATCEDLHLASFAGQFESYLDVLADQIFETIRKCWASVFSGRVLTYTMFHNIEMGLVKMAVLIQEMIKQEKGGVMFTKNIVGGNPYAIVIEASFGSVDEVVAGVVEPERIVVNKKTKVKVSCVSPSGKVLETDELKSLVRLGMDVEDYFKGVPQDIEWGIKSGEIYLFQARPITT